MRDLHRHPGGLHRHPGDLHPNEVDLAWLSELDDCTDISDVEVGEHLRWCADCRSVVADHRWLQEEVVAALAVAVSVPRPKWWAVQEVLLRRTRSKSKQRRQVAGWRGSAVASVGGPGPALSICLMLWTGSKPRPSPLLGTSAIMALTAQTSLPEALYCPVQDSALVAVVPEVVDQVQAGDRLVSISAVPALYCPVQDSAMPTPALFREVYEVTPSPTPVLVLPPTPAQPET